MVDWRTIASLATASGTLILALATFSSVRAANRSAKVSELALLESNLPLLVSSHIYDPAEKIRFMDDYWIKLGGGQAHAAATKNTIYFAISLRNAGQGLAVLDRWSFTTDVTAGSWRKDPDDPSTFRRLTRDLYVPSGDTGFWQGTIRDPNDPQFAEAAAAIAEHREIMIDIQYYNQEGGQRTVSRFDLAYRDKDIWLASSIRHWRLNGTNPRP